MRELPILTNCGVSPFSNSALFKLRERRFSVRIRAIFSSSEAKDSQSLWWIVQIYLTRWKSEEPFRFIKQSYNLEDIRVMKYKRLKNLVILVTAVAYFAATFLGRQIKLRILVRKVDDYLAALLRHSAVPVLYAGR
jgi:hypothetical protein